MTELVKVTVINGTTGEVTVEMRDPEEALGGIPPEPEMVTVLFAVDLWTRLTDAEAEQVEQAIATQPVRLQNIFRAANSYRSDHELWEILQTITSSLFGESRAEELLAPSVQV